MKQIETFVLLCYLVETVSERWSFLHLRKCSDNSGKDTPAIIRVRGHLKMPLVQRKKDLFF